jgi:hypothetical protein
MAHKYPFIARLIEIDKDDKPVGVLDEHEFLAISWTGAFRAASQWVSRHHVTDPFQGSTWWGDWQILDLDTKKWWRWTPVGVIVLSPQIPDQRQPDLERFMEEIRGGSPEEVRQLHRSDRAGFRNRVWAYFRYRLEQSGDGDVGADVREEADLLYDLSGMPSLIADALGMGVGDLRRWLSRRRTVQCAHCGRSFRVLEYRRQGGYVEADLCDTCEWMWSRR